MNRFFVSFITLHLLLFSGAIDVAPAAGGPRAILPETVFEFGTVVEGTEIAHDFVILNYGDEPLQINQVLSG
jgi:hypothetical protein